MTPEIHVSAFRNGDHICFFYKDLEEQLATAAPFVMLGLLRGERCLCVLPANKMQPLFQALESLRVDVDKEVQRGALLIRSPEETYLKGGMFNREQMVKLLDEAMHESLKMGFAGFRGTGDLSWSISDTNTCGQMPGYEHMLNKYYPGKKSLGICMYDASLFDQDNLNRIMESHRLALIHPAPVEARAIRVRNAQGFGDVIFDRTSPRLFHYTVQQTGSNEFVHLGQESSLTAALAAVETTLQTLGPAAA